MKIRTLLLCRRFGRGPPGRTSLSSSHPTLSFTASSLSTHRHHRPIQQEETLALLNPDSPFSSSSSDYCLKTLNQQARHVGGNGILSEPTSSLCYYATLRFISTASSQDSRGNQETPVQHEIDDEVEPIEWEEEDDAEPEIGDGGDGGGVVLQNCPWGEHTLSIANEVLLQFADDMKLFAFKTTPRGYIYVRLDKLSNEYGCPSIEEIENYSHQFKKRLDEAGALREIPDDLALEVSSPGAERLLKVPDDVQRFKDMPVRVSYVEELAAAKCPEKNGVFFLDSVKTESESCVWRLADVKENRDPSAKGRPLSRKQKDWRLELPYSMLRRITLYLDY